MIRGGPYGPRPFTNPLDRWTVAIAPFCQNPGPPGAGEAVLPPPKVSHWSGSIRVLIKLRAGQ